MGGARDTDGQPLPSIPKPRTALGRVTSWRYCHAHCSVCIEQASQVSQSSFDQDCAIAGANPNHSRRDPNYPQQRSDCDFRHKCKAAPYSQRGSLPVTLLAAAAEGVLRAPPSAPWPGARRRHIDLVASDSVTPNLQVHAKPLAVSDPWTVPDSRPENTQRLRWWGPGHPAGQPHAQTPVRLQRPLVSEVWSLATQRPEVPDPA